MKYHHFREMPGGVFTAALVILLFICLKGLATRAILHSHVYSMKLTSSNPIIDPSPLSLKDFGVYEKNRNRDGK